MRACIPFVAILGVVFASSPSKAETEVLRWVIGSGGGVAAGSSHEVQATIGQPLAGRSSGTTHETGTGYWIDGGEDPSGQAEPAPPSRLSIGPVVPNPSGGEISIQYQLPRLAPVRFEMFDVQGRSVRVLLLADQPAGVHRIEWDGRGRDGSLVPIGAYWMRIRVGDHETRRRVTIVR